jgi:uncharacterized membrane protein YgaE (UPF0421/DUF939 family)
MEKKIYPYALFSLILGIISYVQLLGLERAFLAVIFGVLALKQINKDETIKGKKQAYAGIILGLLYTGIIMFMLIFKGGEIFKMLK